MYDKRAEPVGVGRNSSSFMGLVDRLVGDLLRLLDQKLALLKIELNEQFTAAVRTFLFLAIGGVVVGLGLLFFAIALALWVGEVINTIPGGFALVAGVFTVAGGILLMTMKGKLSQQRFVPKETVQELRRDAEWIKREL